MRKRPPGRSPTGRLIRMDRGQRRLIRRDPDVLRLIGEQYTYRFDQLQGQLARHPDSQSHDPTVLSETRTRNAIQKWEQLGLARSRKIFQDEPAYVWLTPRGLRFVDLEVAPWSPTDRLGHPYWINEVRALRDMLATEFSDDWQHYEWESERLWRARRNRLFKEYKGQAVQKIPRSYHCKHIPDAVIHFVRAGVQYHVAIEVQLSIKTESWFRTVWNALLLTHTAVFYYVSPKIKEPFMKMLQKWQQATPGGQEVPTQARQNIIVAELEQFL